MAITVNLRYSGTGGKARAFAEFARRYGIEELLDCLERNERQASSIIVKELWVTMITLMTWKN